MKTFKYTIKDDYGIHARPAGKLVKLAQGFEGTKITIEKDGKSVDAAKLMMLMSLCIKRGDTVCIRIEGGNESAALSAISRFMSSSL